MHIQFLDKYIDEIEQTQTERERKLYEALSYAKSFIVRCSDWYGDDPNTELIDKTLEECKPTTEKE